jgi:hypothetical protein
MKSLHDATEPGGHGSLVRVDTGKKLLTTGKKIKVHPYSPNWKENLRHWGKNLRICTLNLFAPGISYLYV